MNRDDTYTMLLCVAFDLSREVHPIKIALRPSNFYLTSLKGANRIPGVFKDFIDSFILYGLSTHCMLFKVKLFVDCNNFFQIIIV